MSAIPINQVYLEDDLSVFKTITGNRSVLPLRVKKIKDSISAVGMIDAPIVCNENMEVIDGQGRLQACRELGQPVPYIIIEGLTIEHCRAMNLNQTNWKLRDYIRSFADEGNASYMRLEDFMDTAKFQDGIALDIVFHTDASNHTKEIQEGRLVFSEVDKARAMVKAAWLHQFDGIKTNRRREFYRALTFCRDIKSVDNDVLLRKVLADPRAFENLASVYDCLGILDDIYNKRARDRVWIQHEYDVFIEQRGLAAAVAAKRKANNQQSSVIDPLTAK